MKLRAALKVARGRTIRPKGYSHAIGGIVTVLYIIVLCRVGANLYIAQYVVGNSGLTPALGRLTMVLFGRVNLAWCALFLATVAPAVVFRGIAGFARSSRFRLLPVAPSRLVAESLMSSMQSLPVLGAVGVGLVQAVLSITAGDWRFGIELLPFLVLGGIGFVILYLAAWKLAVSVENLELVEIGMLILMVGANPVLYLESGRPIALFFGHFTFSPRFAAGPYLIPLIGVILAAAALFLSRLMKFDRRKFRLGPRSVGLALYRRRIPLGLFVSTYAVELPVVLAAPVAAARNLMLMLLVVRLLWFLAFVVQSEQEIGRVLRVPSEAGRRRSLYRPPAQVHLLLCALSPVIFLLRLIA